MSAGKDKLVTVRMAEGHVLYVDEEARYPGQLVELPAQEAKDLLAAGHAEDPDEQEKRRQELEEQRRRALLERQQLDD